MGRSHEDITFRERANFTRSTNRRRCFSAQISFNPNTYNQKGLGSVPIVQNRKSKQQVLFYYEQQCGIRCRSSFSVVIINRTIQYRPIFVDKHQSCFLSRTRSALRIISGRCPRLFYLIFIFSFYQLVTLNRLVLYESVCYFTVLC